MNIEQIMRLTDILADRYRTMRIHCDQASSYDYAAARAALEAALTEKQDQRIAELEAQLAMALSANGVTSTVYPELYVARERIKELEAENETAYSAGMVEGERVCMGRIAELEAALASALTEKQETHCESTNQTDRRPDMFCRVSMCSVLGECSKECRHPAPVNQALQTITDFDQMREATEVLARRIAELEVEKDAWQGRFYAVEGKVKKLEQLLEALKWLDIWMGHRPLYECIDKVRAALAQAEGNV